MNEICFICEKEISNEDSKIKLTGKNKETKQSLPVRYFHLDKGCYHTYKQNYDNDGKLKQVVPTVDHRKEEFKNDGCPGCWYSGFNPAWFDITIEDRDKKCSECKQAKKRINWIPYHYSVEDPPHPLVESNSMSEVSEHLMLRHNCKYATYSASSVELYNTKKAFDARTPKQTFAVKGILAQEGAICPPPNLSNK